MRTKLLKASVVFALLAILSGLFVSFIRHRIEPSSFPLIRHNMSESEVEHVLGGPAGNYDGYRQSGLFFASVIPTTWVSKIWCSRKGAVRVLFDAEGRVMTWTTGEAYPDTWLAKLGDRWIWHEQERRDRIRLQHIKAMQDIVNRAQAGAKQ